MNDRKKTKKKNVTKYKMQKRLILFTQNRIIYFHWLLYFGATVFVLFFFRRKNRTKKTYIHIDTLTANKKNGKAIRSFIRSFCWCECFFFLLFNLRNRDQHRVLPRSNRIYIHEFSLQSVAYLKVIFFSFRATCLQYD